MLAPLLHSDTLLLDTMDLLNQHISVPILLAVGSVLASPPATCVGVTVLILKMSMNTSQQPSGAREGKG